MRIFPIVLILVLFFAPFALAQVETDSVSITGELEAVAKEFGLNLSQLFAVGAVIILLISILKDSVGIKRWMIPLGAFIISSVYSMYIYVGKPDVPNWGGAVVATLILFIIEVGGVSFIKGIAHKVGVPK